VSALQDLIAQPYEQAKSGDWDRVLQEWADIPVVARRCSRYQKDSSGWTFLHQAAYFGHENACRELIRLGVSVEQLSRDGKSAVDVSREKGHLSLADLLHRALEGQRSVWTASTDSDLLPSSNLWEDAAERRADDVMLVAYADGVVKISKGKRYYSDFFGRTLVGWHGTFDPPCGMDGESML
jgi:hypothetical protein